MAEEEAVYEGIAEIYEQLIEIVGVEHTKRIYEHFKGQQITFPMRFYKTEFIKMEVKRQYDGKNLKELAKRYGYTERYMRELLKKAE